MAPLPRRVVAGYWTYWGSPIRLKDIPAGYNTVFLFHATPVGGAPGSTGAVQWNNPGNGRGAATNFKADLAEFRRTRTAILTVGGARANVDISTRARAEAFLDSIKRIYGELGGFDGLDWNNYEGAQQPDTDQMIWISLQLKAAYGQSFAITSPPAPWRPADVTHCKAMIEAGVMDMVSPQYYDGPGLAEEGYIVKSVNEWVARMGDASRVGVGFGLANAVNFSTRAAVEGAWKTLAARHPKLRGAFNWDMPTDEGLGWSFANYVGPLMIGALTTAPFVIPMPVCVTGRTHTVVAGDTLAGTAARYGIANRQELVAVDGNLTPASLRVGQPLKLPDAAKKPPVTNPTAPPVVNATMPTAPSGARLPQRVVGTYWFHVSGQRLNTVHPACSVVWIAFDDAAGGGGNVEFDMNARLDQATFKADMAELRTRTAPPKIILSSFGRPNNGPDLTSTTGADEFAADIIRISKDYGFDGFNWDLEHAPKVTAANLERASRAIVTEMRKTNPAFSLTVASHLGPSGDFAHNNNGRIYADFAHRCKDIIDLVQPQ
jgi:chitinase